MNITKVISIAALFALSAATTQAATVINQSAGLANADADVDFSTGAVPRRTSITDQFQGEGLTFTPQLTLLDERFAANDGGYTDRANFDDEALFNFGTVNGRFAFFDPFSILFEQAVTDATLAFSSNNATVTFSALLGGRTVESFTTTPNGRINGFFGFTDITFDEIMVDVSNATAGGRGAAIDNVAYNVAAVPLPAGVVLLITALGGIGMLGRRRKP